MSNCSKWLKKWRSKVFIGTEIGFQKRSPWKKRTLEKQLTLCNKCENLQEQEDTWVRYSDKKHHQGSRSQEMAPRLSTPNSTRLTDTTGWFELIKSLCYVCGQATTEWGPTFSIDWKLGNQIYAPVTLPLWPQPIYSKTVHCMRLSTKLHGQQWPHWLRNSTVILQVCGGQQRLCGRLRLPSKWGERKEEKKSVKMKKKGKR